MDTIEALKARHSVRRYKDKKIEGETLEKFTQAIDECNKESGLNIQLFVDEPTAFTGMMAHYGKFTGVRNYIALVGKKGRELEERCGYYGEKLVIEAQKLGMNTCWVAMTFSKSKSKEFIKIQPREKLLMVIAIGYGETDGTAHKGKTMQDVSKTTGITPEWFKKGIEAVLLAPTAMNQQKFTFSLSGNTVKAAAGRGFYTETDLGIAKYHFELGAGNTGWKWADN